MSAQSNPLSDARAEQVVAYVRALGSEGRVLVLDGHGMDCLASAGLSRANVDKAINALVDAGRVRLIVESKAMPAVGIAQATITVRLVAGANP